MVSLQSIVDRTLRQEKERFAPTFYELHSRRVRQSLSGQWVCLSILVLFAALVSLPVLGGWGPVFPAAFGAALLLYGLMTTTAGTKDIYRARALPYFERRLNNIDTWLAGKELLWNSRALDEIADTLGVTPLSAFASGDPLISGEEHMLFEPDAALVTVVALLRSPSILLLGERVLSDLTRLQDALELAVESKVRFSLHLREGTSASGYEMDQREGSYF